MERDLRGLHRPYNKPLKSLSWVCKFAQGYSSGSKDFYLNFYLNHLRMIVHHKTEYDHCRWKEGLIRPEDAEVILNIYNQSSATFSERISSVLRSRLNDEDRLIYRTYKNISYYISLAKKLYLIDERYQVTEDGKNLITSSRYTYRVTSEEKQLLLNFLLDTDAYMFLTIAIIHDKMAERVYGEGFYRMYMNHLGVKDGSKYVGSFDANYIDVITYWLEQLDVFGRMGKIRPSVLIEWRKLYNSEIEQIQEDYQCFFKTNYKLYIKQNKLYDRIEKAYKSLSLQGKTDMGFVNLYDIKEKMHMGYDTFSLLLNDYYENNKKRVIILFSNIVSSIDKRRRFLVGEKAVLNMKLILKNQ